MSLSIQQLRGLKDLIQEGVTAGVNVAAETHQAIVRKPFALLEQIAPIAAPVRAVESLERTVATGVYQTIHTINGLAGLVATQVLDWLDESGAPPEDG